ncbi:MAG: mannonate dehydratase, partial [Mesorhizobium sp.]
GIVTALHHVPHGAVWLPAEIERRQREVASLPDGSASELNWEIVESLPVSESIKTQVGEWRSHLPNYRTSLENLARAGISVICYNFMPVLDWTRTDLAWRLPHGGTTMRFDLIDFAAFDIHILKRQAALGDYTPEIAAEAERRYAQMDDRARKVLARSVNSGLPGSTEDTSLDGLAAQLSNYDRIDATALRRHFVDFLAEVVPTAERLGLRLCCHPDDPPFPLLGLPRIMSTEADYSYVLDAVDSPANGLTFCTGSYGTRADNDIVGMVKEFADRIHFVHLRNVTIEDDGSFYEAEHLEGGTDMAHVILALMQEETRRRREGRADWRIPMRPDHGHLLADDIGKTRINPGYSLIGRLKGLAELRGIMRAVERFELA